MAELLDISTDDAVMDGQFVILVRRCVVTGLADSALSPRAIVREVNFREVDASRGKYRLGDVMVSVTEAMLGVYIPEPGDVLSVDDLQFPGEFDVLEVHHATLHTRFRLVCRQPKLSTTGVATCSIYEDASVPDRLGAPVSKRRPLASAVPCAVRPVQQSERIEQGRRSIEDRVFIAIGKNLSIVWGNKHWIDVGGVSYRVVSVPPRQLGEFQELEATRAGQ